MSTLTISSDFGGMSFNTSALSLLKRCGPNKSCNLSTYSIVNIFIGGGVQGNIHPEERNRDIVTFE